MSNTIAYTAGQNTWITVSPIGFRDGTLEIIIGIYTTIVNGKQRVGSFSTYRNNSDGTSTLYEGKAVEIDDHAQNFPEHSNPQTFQVSIALRSVNDLDKFDILWTDEKNQKFPLIAHRIS